MISPQLDRLQSQLLTSGLSQKNQPLYQVIHDLIKAVRQGFGEIESSIISITPSPSPPSGGGVSIAGDHPLDREREYDDSGPLVIIGPKGDKGIQGLMGPPGMDGICCDYDAAPPLIVPFTISYGAWTPSLGGSGGQSGQAYTTQLGFYVKIGQLVIAWYFIDLSTLGTITTDAEIQGLPFTVNASFTGGVNAIQFNQLTTNFVNVQAVIFPNSTIARIRGNMAASTSNALGLVQADFSNITSLAGTLVYRASA